MIPGRDLTVVSCDNQELLLSFLDPGRAKKPPFSSVSPLSWACQNPVRLQHLSTPSALHPPAPEASFYLHYLWVFRRNSDFSQSTRRHFHPSQQIKIPIHAQPDYTDLTLMSQM